MSTTAGSHAHDTERVRPRDDPRGAAAPLGRGVLVADGDAPPSRWADAPRIRIDADTLAEPGPVADLLHGHWSQRRPVVVEVAVDVDALRAPEADERPPYELDPMFEFAVERLYFLARSNNYDAARSGTPTWGPALVATKLGARPADNADVLLPDGTPAWLDGGPRQSGLGLPPGHVLVHRVRLDAPGRELVADRDAVVSAQLAPDQLAAVMHPGGPARIVAPAGSGKTRVLTERFRHLVRGRGWGSSAVCAVAYNVRAKAEMESRLRDVAAADRRKIRTLHALGNDVLRRGRVVGEVINEWDVRRRIEPHVPVRPRANTDIYAPYLEALTAVRLALVAPEAVEAARDDIEGFVPLFHAYRDRLGADGVIDHDEQIYGALEVLCTDPRVRRALQAECRHLLVDELQDLTPAQLLMLRLVAAPAYDVFGVGDDDQVIYGYAGADPGFLIDYDRYFPGAAHLQLEVNYRCPAEIVEAAANVLTYNRRRVAKQIRAAKPSGRVSAVEVLTHPAEQLADAAVTAVQSRLDAGARPGDIAALARVRSVLLPVQLLCGEAGVPADAPVGAEVLERTGVKAALAWLRLALGVDAGALAATDLAVAIRRPSRGLARDAAARISRRRRWTLGGLRDLAAGEARGRLHEFVADLDALGKALGAGATTTRFLRLVRDDIGLGGALETLDRSGRGPDASHRDDLNALLAVAPHVPDPAAFEAWLRARLTTPRVDPGAEEVTLSTVHRVKGMEWPFVVVLGAHDGLMPHHLADDLEEERRIFHVAITRADAGVHVLAATGSRTPFVEQMRTPASPRAAGPRAVRQGPVPPLVAAPRTGLVAALGLEVTFAGSTGEIVEVRADGAVIAAGPSVRVVVPYGERVDHEGRRAALVAPEGTRRREPIEGSGPLLDALKAWRRERARADGVPAYVVLHDTHLAAIAQRSPPTMQDLAGCPGIGPTKLERYGDEIVAVVAEDADSG